MNKEDFEKLRAEINNFLNDEGRDTDFEDYKRLDGWYSIDKLISILKDNFLVIYLGKA